MRVLLQRVKTASVEVDGKIVGTIRKGFLLFVGITDSDTEAEAQWLARKVSGLRVFEDSDGKFNLSLKEVDGEALVVSQFTLYGDTKKGKRPSFTNAAHPEKAEPLCDYFAEELRAEGHHVSEGVFGAKMMVNLQNDGPVTLLLEKEYSA